MITGAQVIIDSVDQTSKLTGVVEIDIEEGKARTAFFTLKPGAGITDLVGWVNKSVVIKSDIDSTLKTEFTGVIDEPELDLTTGLCRFSCTDNLQEGFETKTKTEIDTIIGGYWSKAVFNDSDGWEYAQQQLSTLPSALDMDELNAIRITPWAAKATPDYTFNDSGYIYESLKIDQYANRMNIINAVDISLKYRYVRLWERQQAYNFDDSKSDAVFVCDQASNPYPVPNKTRIEDAIEQTGWELLTAITYVEIPVGGPYAPCGVNSTGNPLVCRGASFALGKRYSQNVTENYTIRVESADSKDAFGEIAVIETGEIATDYDLTLWNASKIADGWTGFGTPASAPNGDDYVNKDNDTERQAAINTIVEAAKTRILSTHRNTIISFEIPYHQNIDVIHTAQVGTIAKGKVSRVVKTIDVVTGEAKCLVSLRISKKIGIGIPGTEDPPATPAGLPSSPDTQTADLDLLYHLGGQHVPPDYDSNWSGWIANYDNITEPTNVYPKEFVIHTPAITLNSVDNAEPTDNSLVNVTIPDDLLA